MLILSLKTDQSEAELWLHNNDHELSHLQWPAYLKLAETINSKIEELLKSANKSLEDLRGIVCFKGPGSFTGLRIGMSVANALAYAQDISIIAITGQDWQKTGIKKLLDGQTDKIVLPEYSHPAITTQPKK